MGERGIEPRRLRLESAPEVPRLHGKVEVYGADERNLALARGGSDQGGMAVAYRQLLQRNRHNAEFELLVAHWNPWAYRATDVPSRIPFRSASVTAVLGPLRGPAARHPMTMLGRLARNSIRREGQRHSGRVHSARMDDGSGR